MLMVNEFIKSGPTQVPSDLVKPFRVKVPVQFECKVTQIIALGEKGGAGSFVRGKVKIHNYASFRRKRSNRSI
jgi:flavin reductase (DIM6/NTAB) family NADH-FMN oxidoreductase RutF